MIAHIANSLVLAFALLAIFSTAQAQTKTFTVAATNSVGQDATAKLGDTAVITRTLTPGAKLFQSGIYVETASKSKLLNFQVTIVIESGSGDFPPGHIFAVGSGTGIQDPATMPKTIVGGTGPYANARGTLSSQSTSQGKQITITLLPGTKSVTSG